MEVTIRGCDEAAEYVAGIAFTTGPPRLIGVELEWTVHHGEDLTRPVDTALLARALRPHAPPILDPRSDHLPLPHGGVLSVEPGGQVEISSPPHASLAALYSETSADVAHLTDLLARAGLRTGDSATDAHRPPRRLLRTPRYDAMADALAEDGPEGATMMCATTAVQVSLDAGEPSQVAARWAALHALGPVLLALFANSSQYAGRRSGWASTRMRAWLRMNPARTGPVAVSDDPAADWARYALRGPVLCVRRDSGRWLRPPAGTTFADWVGGALGQRPTYADLDYHLSTLFPPVRPRGHVEVRYLDQQPAREWYVPVAVLASLLVDGVSVDAVRDLCAPAEGRWEQAARLGLAQPDIAVAAKAVAELAGGLLGRTGLPQGVCDEVNEVVDRRLTAHPDCHRSDTPRGDVRTDRQASNKRSWATEFSR